LSSEEQGLGVLYNLKYDSVILAKYKAILAALEDVKTESTTTEAHTKVNAFIHLMGRSTFICCGDRSCLHPYASVEDGVRSLSGNDFLTVLSIYESLVHITF
jgi:hypothetical protein